MRNGFRMGKGMFLYLLAASSRSVSVRKYLIPFVVILFSFILGRLLYQYFERAVVVLAPLLLAACALCGLAGVVYWVLAGRNAQRRAERHCELAAIVQHLTTGRTPGSAHSIGASWRALEAIRCIAANGPSDEVELVRAGLRRAGTGAVVGTRALKSRWKWERVRALHDLGWLDDRDTLPILYRALADADNDIAWAGVEALGEMSDPIADQVLLELLDDGRFAPSRIANVLDVRKHRPVSLLEERTGASSDGSLFWIAYLLGRSLQPSALIPLLELAQHTSPNVRASAAEAMGRLGSQATAIETLLRMVNDEVWYVRLHASRSLGDLGARMGVPALQHAMQDSNWWVRRSALDSLRRLREAV
jgi:hypothetical protein